MKWTSSISPLIKEVELRKNPVIIRVNKFDDESAKAFSDEIALAHNLMSMISAIKNSDLPVATIIEGKAMSCGAVLFSFGEQGYRFIDENATVMIHDVSSMDMGKVEELKAKAKEADRLNTIVYTMMAQNCGKADDYFMKIVDTKKHADWFLDSKQAKKHGLANHIRVPSLGIVISVDIEFE